MKQLKITPNITSRDSASLDLYLQDISKIPMVSADEEVDLALRIRKGDESALQRLVTANLRFVVSVAKQYQSHGLSLPDLINEGNLGLMKAARKFDETRGFKFISFAVWWIRQSILQALGEQSRTIRLPFNHSGLINRINRAIETFEQQFGRRPTENELSDILDVEEDKIKVGLSTSSRPISLDAPLQDDDDSNNYGAVIPDSNTPTTDSRLDKESMKHDLHCLLDVLSDKERTIITLCYGIGTREESLDEISERLSLTRERVRQIKEKAIRRLRENDKHDILRAYLS
ncbi:MAG: RNA polymerase sigma factor RpoD/SigA [Bacteroidaceae bacterium]|nr:RNA polymerase sigma factor RpoD/SigA [Bacteroidaceae bacterium]